MAANRETTDRQILNRFDQARNGAAPLQVYGEKHINMGAARHAAAQAGVSLDRVIDTVRKQGRHTEF